MIWLLSLLSKLSELFEKYGGADFKHDEPYF